MAVVGYVSLPASNFFQANPYHYHMDAQRIPSPGYPSAPYPPASRSPKDTSPRSAAQFGSSTPAFEHPFKPSLPSISNLLGYASTDGPGKIAEGPTEDGFKQHQQKQHIPPPSSTSSRPHTSHAETHSTQHDQANSILLKPIYVREGSVSQQVFTPPTPTFRLHDPISQGMRSPSVLSTRSSTSAAQPSPMPSILNTTDSNDFRNSYRPSLKRPSFTSYPDASPPRKAARLSLDSPYSHLPGALSTSAHFSPPQTRQLIPRTLSLQPPPSILPLASSLPPPPPGPPAPPSTLHPPETSSSPQSYPSIITTKTSNLWEHHHYISPSAQAAFLPSPDRYVCPRCSKAFSRPSSLKIHSHSHTGEKPFKCPHAGCGKGFSVMSNMKRHERGCHAGPGEGFAGEGSRGV